MKHYWVLGLLGIGFYGIFEFSRGELWFQDDHETPVVAELARSGSSDFMWSGEVRRGRTLEIRGINGAVAARRGSGDQVIVRASKRSRRSNANEVHIEVVEHAGGVTVCAIYPSRKAENVCAPGDQARLNSDNSDVNVNFEVSVPPGVVFVGQTVNGGLNIDMLDGPVEAQTVNGSIKVAAAGPVKAATVNGGIEAVVRESNLGGSVELETVNGRVVLALPDGVNADVTGSTSNGQITSEFPLTVRGRFGPKQVSGVIGVGGDDIRLQSVNGSISVVRRRLNN